MQTQLYLVNSAILASNIDNWNQLSISLQKMYRRESHSKKNQFQMLGGISVDHRIEQAFMLNLKSEDRITKGRFKRLLAYLFVFLRPLCPEIMDGIEELSSFSLVARTEIKQGSGNSSMIRDKSNGNRTHNHLVCYWTPNHLTKLGKRLSCVVSTYLHDVFH